MKRKTKRWKRKKPFYQKVAKAIVEGSPFDVSTTAGGWKKVQELVALYMLKDINDADRYKIWNDFSAKVERVFHGATEYINQEWDGIHVYIHRPVGKRNNEFLSIQKDYRQAESRNTDRVLTRMESTVKHTIKEIRKTQPERLKESHHKIRALLPFNGEKRDVLHKSRFI